MNSLRPAIFACVLSLSTAIPAQQNPPAGRPTQPQTVPPGQEAPPAQQPQTAEPSQTQPSQSPSAPSAQPPSIDDQVKVLTQELNLNDDQQGKIKTVLVDQRQQASTVIADNTLSRDDKVQKIRALREATIARVRGVLNDDQKKKLDQMLEGPPQPQSQPKEPPK